MTGIPPVDASSGVSHDGSYRSVTGKVVEVNPSDTVDGAGTVIALVQYAPSGESMLFELPLSWWPHSPVPQIDQRFRLKWRGEEDPRLQVLDDPLSPTWAPQPVPSSEDLQDLLGMRAGDKVLIVVGPNPKPTDSDRYREWIATSGWGETLALRRLPYLLLSAGVRPQDVDYMICPGEPRPFAPQTYGDHHIIFLGSTKSNAILRDHYWEQLNLQGKYQFSETPNALSAQVGSESNTFNYESRVPSDLDTVEIRDPFLLARTGNPYDSGGRSRCILSCGCGSLGTGYGVVTLSASKSAMQLLNWYDGQDFDLVGCADVHGFIDPDRDPVQCLWGCENPPQSLLEHALKSPAVWEEGAGGGEADREVLRRVVSRYP